MASCTNLIFIIETVFPPADKAFGSPNLANASNVPHQSNNSMPVQGPEQPYHDIYEHIWSRNLIIMIYSLTLGLAGNLLWAFLGDGATQFLKLEPGLLAQTYAAWIEYDLCIVWLFTTGSLFLQYVEPTLRSTGTISPLERLEDHIMPCVRSPWIFSIAWSFLILGLLGSSAGFGYVKLQWWSSNPWRN